VINIFFSPSNSPVFYPGHFPLSSCFGKFREILLNNGYPCVRLSRLLPRGLSTIHMPALEMVLPLLQCAILKKETVEKTNCENNCMANMLLYKVTMEVYPIFCVTNIKFHNI